MKTKVIEIVGAGKDNSRHVHDGYGGKYAPGEIVEIDVETAESLIEACQAKGSRKKKSVESDNETDS